jgi:hypothetical protein
MSTPPAPEQNTTGAGATRYRLLLHSAVAIVGAAVWLVAWAKLTQSLDSGSAAETPWWGRALTVLAGLLAALGLSRGSKARAGRFDLVGLLAAVVMLGGWLMVLLWLFLTVLTLSPGSLFGG